MGSRLENHHCKITIHHPRDPNKLRACVIGYKMDIQTWMISVQSHGCTTTGHIPLRDFVSASIDSLIAYFCSKGSYCLFG